MRESSSTPDALSNAATILAGVAMACMACATWRAVDTAITCNSDVLAVQNRHHQELVGSIQSLAEKSGILTSADLCPVRFRFRRVDGYTIPLAGPVATLEVETDGRYEHLGSRSATTAGTVDFGLVAPGQYRVTVQMDDGMHLRHDFNVLPGVPVDRLITCPGQSAPSNNAKLDLQWPDLPHGGRLLAVCCIEPAGCTVGDWAWQPSELAEPVHVLAVSAGDEVSAVGLGEVNRWFPDSPGTRLQPASAFSTSFRYCRLTQITVLFQTGTKQETEVLGNAVFTGGIERVGSRSADALAWNSETPPPYIELQYANNHWLVRLPDDIVTPVTERIREHHARWSAFPQSRIVTESGTNTGPHP